MNSNGKQSKQEIQLKAVKAILSGELLIEEAMAKYKVKDKRTIASWIKKTTPILEMANAIPSYKYKPGPTSSTNTDVPHFDALRENTFLKKIIELQNHVSKLESKNRQLNKHRDQLMRELSNLERKHCILYAKTSKKNAKQEKLS